MTLDVLIDCAWFGSSGIKVVRYRSSIWRQKGIKNIDGPTIRSNRDPAWHPRPAVSKTDRDGRMTALSEAVFRFSNPLWAITVLQVCSRNSCTRKLIWAEWTGCFCIVFTKRLATYASQTHFCTAQIRRDFRYPGDLCHYFVNRTSISHVRETL